MDIHLHVCTHVTHNVHTNTWCVWPSICARRHVLHVCGHTCIFRTHACVYEYMHTELHDMHVKTPSHMHVRTTKHLRVCMCTRQNTCMHAYCTYVDTPAHTQCVCVHEYMHMQIHTACTWTHLHALIHAGPPKHTRATQAHICRHTHTVVPLLPCVLPSMWILLGAPFLPPLPPPPREKKF